MYERLDRGGGRVLGYRLGEELTEVELETLLEDVEATIHEEGEVRLLVHVPSWPSVDPSALDEDIGFWLQHGDDVERYAVVGDSRLMEAVVELEDRVVGTDIRCFDTEDIEAAWAWLQPDE